MSHFLELRKRLLKIGLFFLILFVLFFYFSNPLFQCLVSPLQRILPLNETIVAIGVTSPVVTPLQLAFNVALLCVIPYILFHIWRFISPGLYRSEQAGIAGFFVVSLGLFIAGVLFCYYGVLPFMFHLFSMMRPPNVRFLPDIASTVSFILQMLIIFGLCFQLPLICVVLARMNVLSLEKLSQIRPYVIVLAFIAGMLLTPPDVFSQITLAVPLCLLFESGLLFLRFKHWRSIHF
jgi:sec-independent protein translocase protein TatC